MKNYLGIDFGTKNIGLAIADGPLARPLTTLKMSEGAVTQVAQIAAENDIQEIVIGLPEGELDTQVRSFGQELNRISEIPVQYHPETLSSQEAIMALRAVGAQRAKLKNDHVYAACIILEDFLSTKD